MPRSRWGYWFYRSAIFMIALLVLLLWGNNLYVNVTQRSMGTYERQDGTLLYAHERTGLQSGDLLLTIEGQAYGVSRFPTYNDSFWPAKQSLNVEVLRDGVRTSQTVPFDQPAPLPLLALTLPIVVVALLFWAAGLWVISYHATEQREAAIVYFIFTQLMALLLSSGGIDYLSASFQLQVAMVGFLAVSTFHLVLLLTQKQVGRNSERLLWFAYTLSFVGAIIFVLPLVSGAADALPSRLNSINSVAGLLTYAIMQLFWFASVAALFFARRYKHVAELQRQQDIVVISGLVALAPMTLLSFLPQFLDVFGFQGLPVLPFHLSMLTLVAIPLGFGYAIRRYRLIRLERTVSRAMVVLLTFVILVALYGVLLAILELLLPTSVIDNTFSKAVLIVALGVTFNIVRERLQRWVDTRLYGYWSDVDQALKSLSASFSQSPAEGSFDASLAQTLQQVVQAQWVELWRGEEDRFSPVVALGENRAGILPWASPGVRNHPLIGWLTEYSGAITAAQIVERFSATDSELLGRIQGGDIALLAPIANDHQLYLLVIGEKFGGEPYTDRDIALVNLLVRHAALALANNQLAEALMMRVAEAERYQRRLSSVQDEERKRIARELHDQVIQSMVGLRYQLSAIQNHFDLHPASVQMDSNVHALQDQLGGLIQTTRSLCADLRPPVLSLGVVPGLRSVVAAFRATSSADVHFLLHAPLGEGVEIPEAVMLCLHRCLQEALTNIAKHADAQTVAIEFHLEPGAVRLMVHDNGRGAQLPVRLAMLMSEEHFGLVGMRERVELLGGRFDVITQPNQGMTIVISIRWQDTAQLT